MPFSEVVNDRKDDYTIDLVVRSVETIAEYFSDTRGVGEITAQTHLGEQFCVYRFIQGLQEGAKIERLAENRARIPENVKVGNQDSNGFRVLSYTDGQGRKNELVIAVQADGVSIVANKSGKLYATDSGLIATTLVGGSLELIPRMLESGKLSIHELLISLNERLLELFPTGIASGASTFELALMHTSGEGAATVDVFSVVGMADEIHKYMGVFRADTTTNRFSNGVEPSIANHEIALSPYYLHPETEPGYYRSILRNIIGYNRFELGLGDVFAIGTDGAAKLRNALQYKINILHTLPELWWSEARAYELAESLLLPQKSNELTPYNIAAYDDQSILLLQHRPRRAGDDLEPDTV